MPKRLTPEEKFEKQYAKNLQEMKEKNNNDLYIEVLVAQMPDDYDGEFTPFGSWWATQVEDEFRKRLIEIGFLKD